MKNGVPIRISACWLQGENQYPERGLFHVSENEAEMIAQIAVLGLARKRAGEDASPENIYAEVQAILNKFGDDIHNRLLRGTDEGSK